ncbi:polar amino acid ABC transporter inner membrane subunit [Fictibacillus macauensis ZFHKF-1]|uniref:Polar amino acid ABC transporter inner membrane subunit n=1 Tax=Fictibacillus macauensis ZFHKF-1 TaxID=1196324 RepID=I8UK95_9BACL|nr:ABC transporter substrate-binding protein/permease [Fictibacillus macauensis]EIT87305.1 polar amino acid ABC transporter inner membrane subunit [Fictibacillus macauensis ZFHKF-1]
MKKSSWLLLTILMVTISSMLFTPFQQHAAAQGKHAKTLVMGTSADYAPYEFVDTKKSSDVIGFDVDIARKIADRLGYNLEIKDMDFNGLIPALDANRVDFVMAGMTPNAERKKKIDFSSVYYKASQMIVTNQKSIKKVKDLQGKTIGVQLGSIQEKEAKKIASQVNDVAIDKQNKVTDLVEQLKSGRMDAAVIEDGVAVEYLNKNPDLSGFKIPHSDATGTAIALPKNSALTEKFNEQIATMKKNGDIEKIAKKWFEPKKKASDEKRAIIDFSEIFPSVPFILKGIVTTLQFVVVSIIFGFLLGTLLALCKIGGVKPLRWFADAYTSIFRGTPLILQLIVIYNATPQVTGYKISAFVAGVLTFGLNSAAYVSEIIRGGINAVDKGQREASMALGIPKSAMMRQIILPQALKNILPSLMNEFITLTKESAIVAVIGTMDIMRRAQIVSADSYRYLEPLLVAGVIYYVMVMILTVLGRMLERRMSRSD